MRYYNHEEIKSNYFTSFFCLTAKASDLNTTLHEMNASRRPIMILGERGTGKDHIAYRLYLESPYTNKPFISIDCKLITERYWTFLTSTSIRHFATMTTPFISATSRISATPGAASCFH